MNYFSDEKEWQWLFENGIDWESILPHYYPNFPTEDGLKIHKKLKTSIVNY